MDKVKILNIDGVDYEVEDAQARELKQDKVDESLTTTSKEVVGAINELKSNFQAGVDGIYDAIVAEGTTPASKSQSDIERSISTLATNKYNSAKVGTAVEADVAEGKTFTNSRGVNLTGTAKLKPVYPKATMRKWGSSTVYYTMDGETWLTKSSPMSGSLYSTDSAFNPTTGLLTYYVYNNGKARMVYSYDGGITLNLSPNILDYGIEAISVKYSKRGFFLLGGSHKDGTTGGLVYRSTDGINWSKVTMPTVSGMQGSSSWRIAIAPNGNAIASLTKLSNYTTNVISVYYSTDGINWAESDRSIAAQAATRDILQKGQEAFLYVSGKGGYSTTNGYNWGLVTPNNLNGQKCVTGLNINAMGSSGTVYVDNSAAQNWTRWNSSLSTGTYYYCFANDRFIFSADGKQYYRRSLEDELHEMTGGPTSQSREVYSVYDSGFMD